MSEILEVVRPSVDSGPPTLRLRCPCGRVYVTTVARSTARKLARCIACRPPAGRALCRGRKRTPSQRDADWRAAAVARLGRHS